MNPFDAAQRPVATPYTVDALLADCRDIVTVAEYDGVAHVCLQLDDLPLALGLLVELCDRQAEVLAHLRDHRTTASSKGRS